MGITDYLSGSPNNSELGGEDDGMLTITLINDLNSMKKRQIKERVLSKLLKHRKSLIRNRNKASKTKKSENKKQSRKSDRKQRNKETENRNKENVQRISEQLGKDQRIRI